jgi:hypothetical protein
MNVRELKTFLTSNPDLNMQFVLPDGKTIPQHFHVTEVGRVQKDFIDCGGTKRSSVNCLLQTWVAEDTGHRLLSSKLAYILNLANPILKSDEIPVEIEYEGEIISQFTLLSAESSASGLIFQLGTKHTDCLARDKCMIESTAESENNACCSGTGCC